MKYLFTSAFVIILFAEAGFSAAVAANAPADDLFFKEPIHRSLMLETPEGKRIKAVISHKDACQLKPGAQFKLFSIDPYRKIWKHAYPDQK